MTAHTKRVNTAGAGDSGDVRLQPTAPLRNVQLFNELVIRLNDRADHLSGWGVFSGPSGHGKTTAAVHASMRTFAAYLEAGSTWTSSTLVDGLLAELGMHNVKGSVSKKVQEIIRLLSDDPVPLIFDEADHLVKKSLIDLIREISDKSRSPVILIGEIHLPQKLMAFERAHNRVLSWVESVGCNLEDARALVKLYGNGIGIDDNMLRKIVNDTMGVTRRVVINIDRMREFANRHGLKTVTLETYQGEIDRGLPPRMAQRGKVMKAGAQ